MASVGTLRVSYYEMILINYFSSLERTNKILNKVSNLSQIGFLYVELASACGFASVTWGISSLYAEIYFFRLKSISVLILI